MKFIDIKITDNGKFSDIALFFDRKEVLVDAVSIRKSWIGSALVSNLDQFSNLERDLRETKHYWEHFFQTKKLLKKYSKPETFVRPTLAAILVGVVTDSDYTTYYEEDTLFGEPEEIKLESKVGRFSDRVRKVDLPKTKKRDSKSISTIKRDRSWWLLRKKGYSWNELQKELKEVEETIRSAVNSYENKLTGVK